MSSLADPDAVNNPANFAHGAGLEVRNTLSRYCVALDTKNFDLLNEVFTKDVAANYPFNPTLEGTEAVKAAIQKRLGPIKTWHGLTTQVIDFPSKTKATASTHFMGAHFGQGPHEGKVLQAYGIYEDELCQVDGKWRICKRKVMFIKRIGDEKIMEEL